MEKENTAPEHNAGFDPASEDDEAEGRDYPSQDIKLLVVCAVVFAVIMLARWAWLVH